MNRDEIALAAQTVMRLLGQYSNAPHREMLVDPALYAFLEAKFGKMTRQMPIRLGDSHKRIDFRHGGSNPVAIEFAVRPPKGGGQLYGSQNASELRKLSRLSQTKAKLRALLLMDLHSTPHDETDLARTYENVTLGPGRYVRRPVSVIYVHESGSWQFTWKP
jgi:hypothetical protein